MFRTHYCYKSLQLHQLPCINENGTHTKKKNYCLSAVFFKDKIQGYYHHWALRGTYQQHNPYYYNCTPRSINHMGYFLSQEGDDLYVNLLPYVQ